MDDARIGRAVRVIRLRLGLSQRELGARAGQSQQQVSRLERGDLEGATIRALRRILGALGASAEIRIRWRGPELDRLLDAEHARVVAAATTGLQAFGWQVLHEWTFNHFGERGAIDLVAWHPEARAILVVEVKSQLVDLQDVLGSLDRKVRIALSVLAPERGWQPAIVARLLVLPERSGLRAKVARYEALLRPPLPARNRQIATWLRAPRMPLAGIWFVRSASRDRAPSRNRRSRVGGARRAETGHSPPAPARRRG